MDSQQIRPLSSAADKPKTNDNRSPSPTKSSHYNLKFGLERQHCFRSSKKFKRQTSISENNDNTVLLPEKCSTQELTSNSNLNPLIISSQVLQSPMASLQLLACYEDSSFIYCQSSASTSSSTSCLSGSDHSDSMLSSSSSSSSGDSSSSVHLMRHRHQQAGNNKRVAVDHHYSDYSSGGFSASSQPSCISALDYCHLSSSASSFSTSSSPLSSSRQHHQSLPANQRQPRVHDNAAKQDRRSRSPNNSQQHNSSVTNHTLDPVYLEDEKVFHNLILKESNELERRRQALKSRHQADNNNNDHELTGQQRHSLLSWMLKICEHQACQDEIFPLATMILDKFLLFRPPVPSMLCEVDGGSPSVGSNDDSNLESNEFYCDEDELNQRQLYLFAACSLLLATKLRQTPRLAVQHLIEFSKLELPVELNRDEVLDGELLMLTALKWDLAALVTPNDFLALLLRKCSSCSFFARHQSAMSSSSYEQTVIDVEPALDDQTTPNGEQDNSSCCSSANSSNQLATGKTAGKIAPANNSNHSGCDESRVRRHTQTLLELCLMGEYMSA